MDISNDDGGKRGRFIDYAPELVDAHSTLVEFEEDRENILSNNFNTVGLGVAFNEEKVAVVDIFTHRECIVESIMFNENQGIDIIGRMLNEKLGPYAIKIVPEEFPNKQLAHITPQFISYDDKTREFSASFSNCGKVFEYEGPKMIEIFLREKPELIKYGVILTTKVKFEDLILGYRIPFVEYPHPRIANEIEQEEQAEKDKMNEEAKKKKEEETKENNERENRKRKVDNYD